MGLYALKGNMPQNSRIINGDKYIWRDFAKKKSDADTKAKSLRKRGYKARVIKVSGGYNIYTKSLFYI